MKSALWLLVLLAAVKVSVLTAEEESKFGIEITAFYAWNDGVSDYADLDDDTDSGWASYDFIWGFIEDGDDLWIPGIRVYYDFATNWQMGVGYQSMGDFVAQGYFTGGIVIMDMNYVGELLQSREEIDDVYVDLCYRHALTDKIHLEFGAKLSWMHAELSRYLIGTARTNGDVYYDTPLAFDQVSQSYWRLGGMLGLNYELADFWSVGLEYQYLRPRFHELHMVGLKAGYEF